MEPPPRITPASLVPAADSGVGDPPVALGRLGAYELVLELAAGGMAMVYLAFAVDGRATNTLVAIKRPHRHLASDKTFLSMLLDEARLASLIRHENVVKVRELGFHSGEPFIVMDYVEGASLSELRKELAAAERAVDVRIAGRIVIDALAGLHAAHELRDEAGKLVGIVHRDVSPHNVLIGCDGRTRLTDFGIAKAEDRLQTTRTHEVKGKLAYLAPERVDRRRMCNKQSDVFSMAIVFWECIAGRRLFRGEEAIDTLHEVMSGPIPRLRQIGAVVSPALDDVIARGLSRDLDRRFATAAEFSDAIERAMGKPNIATPRDVARVVETVFGPKLAARHGRIRTALPGGHLADEVLAASGLPRRVSFAQPTTASNIALLASIAPAAPSERYSFGKGFADGYARSQARRARWSVASGIALGIAIGAAFTLVLAARASWHTQTAARPAAVAARASDRHVIVPLPFIATQVTFDDTLRKLEPAADVVAFEVSPDSGLRHRVTAAALDGTRAEAYVEETGGTVRAEGEGYLLMTAPSELEVAPVAPAPRAPSLVAPVKRLPARPAQGPTRNGFTKLR